MKATHRCNKYKHQKFVLTIQVAGNLVLLVIFISRVGRSCPHLRRNPNCSLPILKSVSLYFINMRTSI